VYREKRILCIIPARGNSKGLPGKNVLNFSGKPLIAWSIEEAISSNIFDSVIVNTDDERIAQVAEKYGAEIPFMRPKELGMDRVSLMDVLLYVLNKLISNGVSYDISVLLQPTSPLRLTDDIRNAVDMLFQYDADAIVSVCKTEHTPLWINTLPPNGCMKDFLRKDILNKNRQELPIYYRLNGSIYASSVDFLRTKKTFYGEKTYAYIMPRERSIDIDTLLDFQIAEFLHTRKTTK